MRTLLIYELGNKDHLKNINDQNFAHFMGVTANAITVYKLDFKSSYCIDTKINLKLIKIMNTKIFLNY